MEIVKIMSKQKGVKLRKFGKELNFEILIEDKPVEVMQNVAEFLLLDKPNMIYAVDDKGKEIVYDKFVTIDKEKFLAERQKVRDRLEKQTETKKPLSEKSKERIKDFTEDLRDDGKRNRSIKKKGR